MADRSYLDWPFLTPAHKEHALSLDSWAETLGDIDHKDTDNACRTLVARLGADGWLNPTAADPANPAPLDVRTLCLSRETLARHDGLADFAFAMQGLGTGAISLFGSPKQQAEWLPKIASGEVRIALAIAETVEAVKQENLITRMTGDTMEEIDSVSSVQNFSGTCAGYSAVG